MKEKRRPYLPPTTVPLPSARAQLKDRLIGAGLHCNWHTSMLITAMITLHYNSYLKLLFAFLIFCFSLFILLWTKTGNSNNINGTIAWFFKWNDSYDSFCFWEEMLRCCYSFRACVWTLAFILIFCALFFFMWCVLDRSEPSFCTSGLVLRGLRSLMQDVLLLCKGETNLAFVLLKYIEMTCFVCFTKG